MQLCARFSGFYANTDISLQATGACTRAGTEWGSWAGKAAQQHPYSWVGCWHRPGAVQRAGRSQSSRRAVLPRAEVAVTQWTCSQDGHAPPGLIFLFTNEVPWQEERFSPRVRCKVCLNPQALHCTAVGLLLSHLSLVAPASAFRTCLHPDLHPCLVITNIGCPQTFICSCGNATVTLPSPSCSSALLFKVFYPVPTTIWGMLLTATLLLLLKCCSKSTEQCR